MANVIKHKRGSGSDPGASDLILGELAIRTDTGKLFTKMDSGAIAEIAGGGSDIAINTLSSSSATGGGSATFNGSAYRFTLSAPPNVSAAQLLVSINGVIQKPVAGTGQPSEGFSVDGTDIILGDAPATGSDFFILTFKSLGVSEPADNSVTSAKIVDGTITGSDLATNVDLVDDQKLRFGTGNDLQIYHAAGAASHINATGLLNIDGTTGVRLEYNNATKLEITSTGVNLPDNSALELGDRNSGGVQGDLRLYHDGSNSYIDEIGAGNLFIRNGSNTSIFCQTSGTVELYNNGNKKFETTSTGATLTGTLSCDGLAMGDSEILRLGSSQDFQISHDGTSSLIKSVAHPIAHYSNTRHHFLNADGSANVAVLVPGGQCEFYHNGTKHLETTSAGATVTGFLGIGITNPDSPLEVLGTGPSLATIHHSDGGTNDEARIMLGALSTNPPDQRGAGISARNNGAGHNLEIQCSSSHSAGPSTKMTVTSAGNVGIGTTSPGNVLDVQGSGHSKILVGTTGTGHATGLQISHAIGDGALQQWQLQTDASADGNLVVRNATSGNKVMIFDADEYAVAVGTIDPTKMFELQASNNGITDVTEARNTLRFRCNDSTATNNQPFGTILWTTNDSGNSSGNAAFITATDRDQQGTGQLLFGTGNPASEKMRLNQNGVLSLGTDNNSVAVNNVVGISLDGSNGYLAASRNNETFGFNRINSNGNVGRFFKAGNEVGAIFVTAAGTSFVTSSDYRLKENVIPISDGITRLKTLKPSRFNFIADSETTVDGFLAHEITAVPEAVTGTKDAVNEDGSIKPQGIDQSKLVPLLVAALQEAIGRIEALEAK